MRRQPMVRGSEVSPCVACCVLKTTALRVHKIHCYEVSECQERRLPRRATEKNKKNRDSPPLGRPLNPGLPL